MTTPTQRTFGPRQQHDAKLLATHLWGYAELLDTIINQAEAIRSGQHTAPRSAVVALLRHNVDTLAAWTPRGTR